MKAPGSGSSSDSSPDAAMCWRLVGLVTLSSLCSAMLLHPNTQDDSNAEDGSTPDDPGTAPWSGRVPPTFRSGSRSGNLSLSNGGPVMGSMDPVLPPVLDTSICDMLLNAPVPLPVDQIPFFCICSHCKGTVGPKGDHGDRGPPGEPGSPGRRGMMGFKGRPGFTGSQGMKGQKGDLGEKGRDGPVGYTGTKGERGFKGEKGDHGSIGPPGGQGPQGVTGTCPASCDSVQGPPGPQGPSGPAGARGLPGVKGPVGSKGLMGTKGDLGKPGEPGLDGAKGEQGQQGVCECTDGMNGTDGRRGDKGAEGDKGDTGAQGVQGPTGPKGNQGTMGVIGPPGPCSPAIRSAFSACLNESFPKENHPISFPHILTNQQGHFDAVMGIYTAPVNGTYVFSFHLAVAYRTLKVGLFLNLYPVIRTTEGTNQATASQSAILHLSAGDRVWLQVKDSTSNGMFSGSESSSTFSGYLLHPDSCELLFGRNFVPLPIPPPQEEIYSWDGPQHTTTPPPS